MTKTLLIITSSLFLTACFDETEGRDIEPKSMADCITIENPNNRDICKMKMAEKIKEQKIKSLGSKEPTSIRF